jgi:hypothetical protein
MGQEETEKAEERSPAARTLLRALSLPLRLCCCPSPSVLLSRSNKPRSLRRTTTRNAGSAEQRAYLKAIGLELQALCAASGRYNLS